MNRQDFDALCRDFAARCPATERAIIAFQIRRLMKGYEQYGPLAARLSRMDLTREKAEEAADLLMYQAMAEHLERAAAKPVVYPRRRWWRAWWRFS